MKDEATIDVDVQLWDEFRSGNKESFEKLIRLHYRSLHAYATKFRRDHEFAKDCLQELFFELWKNRLSLGSTRYVKSYLFKSVRNKVFRELQRNRWHFQHAQVDDEYCFDVEFSIEHYLIREQTLRETANTLSKVLNELPKRQKEIIYLRYYQDLEIEEIVEIMEINPQSVYNLIHRALENLRQPLASEGIARLK